MSTSVRSLRVTYNPVNEENTFTSGDCVSGQVTLELTEDCLIESLLLQFKGKADVLWTESHGGHSFSVHHSKDKYFSFTRHCFIGDANLNDCSVVAPGCHVFPFTFQIPSQNMPSSFTAASGKIVYWLEAKLSTSNGIAQKDSTVINFVTKADHRSDPRLMTRLRECKDKKMKLFSSGTVAMDVNLEKTSYFPGEGLKVQGCIQNNSFREIKPKYTFYRKHSFFASSTRRVTSTDIFKDMGEPIPPSTNQNITRILTIPHDTEPSILNCNIIKLEYGLRVYLDVEYITDPDLKFTIVILPVAAVGPRGMYPPLEEFSNK